MRTLFGENILSPSSTPHAGSHGTQQNPFELVFASSLSYTSSTSTQSSPNQHSWLTRHSQNQPQSSEIGGTTVQPHNERTVQHSRRRGNPKLLFMGHRRSGKSSIQKLIFHKLAPADTLFLEPTSVITTATVQSFVPISSAELPSHIRFPPIDSKPQPDHATIFSDIGSVVWVLDIQDEYQASIRSLIRTAVFLADHYPRINLEVFIHKIDGLSDEYKYDTFREIRQQFQDEVSDLGYVHQITVSYYQTSIFDDSIFEAMSKVVQKLLPQLPAMETLLNKLCSTCKIQKAYLFDTISKIYIATDASPTFLRDYEVCSDYVDVIVDIKAIYGDWKKKKKNDQINEDQPAAAEAVSESMVTFDHTGDTYIYAREITEHLALLCVMGKGSSADKRVLVDYNVDILQDALLQIFRV